MNCQYCEREFRAVRRDSLYCSRACRQAAYRARRRFGVADRIHQARVKAAQTKRDQTLIYLCLVCGREYEVNGNQITSQYCSAACRKRSSRRRLGELKHFLLEIAHEGPRRAERVFSLDADQG
mgnify:CR=1 FL=1